MRAGDNLAIQFSGDTIAFHSELLDELPKGQGIVEALLFAIDDEAHRE
jgi:hypothetical protein